MTRRSNDTTDRRTVLAVASACTSVESRFEGREVMIGHWDGDGKLGLGMICLGIQAQGVARRRPLIEEMEKRLLFGLRCCRFLQLEVSTQNEALLWFFFPWKVHSGVGGSALLRNEGHMSFSNQRIHSQRPKSRRILPFTSCSF